MPTPTPKSTARCHHLRRRPGLLPATAWAAAWELAAPGLSASKGYHRATEILVPLALGLGAPVWAVDINNQGQVSGMVLLDDAYRSAAFRWTPGCAASTRSGDDGAGAVHSSTFTGTSGSYA